MSRYEWRKPSDLPERVEMIDQVTNQIIAEIVRVGRNWQWKRNTNVLIHGAPPAAGTARGLTQAKVRVQEGLPK